MRKINEEFITNGLGGWTEKVREVNVVGLQLAVYREEGVSKYGELRIYFNTKTWNVKKDGLIYGDDLWLAQLQEYLKSCGYTFNKNNLDYSEAGMQGDNYVSLDTDAKFIKSWEKISNKLCDNATVYDDA